MRSPQNSHGGSERSVIIDLDLHNIVCDKSHIPTNLAIDDRLLEEAQRIGGQKTKRATVTEALYEYIQRRKQQQIVKLFGKVDEHRLLDVCREPTAKPRDSDDRQGLQGIRAGLAVPPARATLSGLS